MTKIFYPNLFKDRRILQEAVSNPKAVIMLMFSVDAADLFDIRPTFWPLSAHLEAVTSQVICFVSIYKTIMRERERATGVTAVPVQAVSLFIYLWIKREKREEREKGREKGREGNGM